MKIRIPYMPRDRIDDVLLVRPQQILDLRKKPREIFWLYDDIVYERRRALSFGMLMQKTEACPAYRKILFFLFLIFRNAQRNAKTRKVLRGILRFSSGMEERISGKLRKQHELGKASKQKHFEFREELPHQRKNV